MNKRDKGFTLIELVVIVAIIGIIATIATPRLVGYSKLAEERVCFANRKTVEKLYSTFILENDFNNESTFNQFLIENFDKVCPSGGIISYVDKKVKCSLHEYASDDDVDEPPDDEVPWL